MGKREASTVRTAKRRLAGQPSTGPSGVADQSYAAIRRPASPPPANRSAAARPCDESGAIHTPPAGAPERERAPATLRCRTGPVLRTVRGENLPCATVRALRSGRTADRVAVGWAQSRRESPGADPRRTPVAELT